MNLRHFGQACALLKLLHGCVLSVRSGSRKKEKRERRPGDNEGTGVRVLIIPSAPLRYCVFLGMRHCFGELRIGIGLDSLVYSPLSSYCVNYYYNNYPRRFYVSDIMLYNIVPVQLFNTAKLTAHCDRSSVNTVTVIPLVSLHFQVD